MNEDQFSEILNALNALESKVGRLVELRAEITSSERSAAREWEALRAALGLDEHATAQGVVTELTNLRAQVDALNLLDGEPVVYETGGAHD